MKNDLDKLCWEKLKILEDRKESARERRAKKLTSQHLLEGCNGVSLVQVSQAVNAFVEEETAMAASLFRDPKQLFLT